MMKPPPTTLTSSGFLNGATVNIYLENGFDIWLHSYFLTGLIQLSQEGAISLRILRGRDARRCAEIQSVGYPLLLLKCTRAAQNNSRLICFDPRDQTDAWQPMALDSCDLYFKRSTYLSDTEQLPKAQQIKVRSINPMFATWHPTLRWSSHIYKTFVQDALIEIARCHSPRRTLTSFLRRSRTFAMLSGLDHYEATPADTKSPQILFQTRLWDPADEKGDWVEPCNQHRVEMVRTLRAHLGNRCVGGLIRTPYAETHYPELLSNLTPNAKVKRPEFIRLCRQFLIRVNIKALFDAIPYSLGETLAANNCLVSETIRNTCATPLVAESHYLSFTTPEECANRCIELLDSPEKAEHLREEAHSYYRNAVAPKEAMRQYLTLAMQ